MKKPDINRILEIVQGEISFVNTTIKDKGANRFARPLLIGALLVGGAYMLVYQPPAKKLAGLSKKLETAKSTAQYADVYKDVRSRLYAIYSQLPLPGNSSLTNDIVESLRVENIISDSLQPPIENEIGGMSVQNVTVTMTVEFKELLAWLLRLENHRPLLHISSLDIRKKGLLGKCEATAVITTVVPKARY